MVLASLLFLAVIAWREGLQASVRGVARGDWPAIIGLSLVGHGLYQALFLGGVARTSVANSALIFGCTPVMVILLAMFCWSTYTVGTRPLLDRYSPVFITGLTMTIGTLVYAPFALTWLKDVDLTAVSALAWVGVVYSAAFALVASYIIWYTAVQQLGGSHTAIYSNVVPIVAMVVASLVLGEPTTSAKLIGTAAVLAG